MGMVEANGVVERVENGQLWVRTETRSACSHCSSGGCGVSSLAGLFGNRRNHLRLQGPGDLQTGDAVVIGIDDGALTRAALLAYLWPLAAMMLSAVLAAAAGIGDTLTALLSLAGLLGGLRLSRTLSGADAGYQPQLLRRAEAVPVQFHLPEENKS